MTTDVDARIAARTGSQHGYITRRQAVELGMTARQISHRLGSGRWERCAPGLYRIAGLPMTWTAKVAGPCIGAGAIGSHRAAAVLWKLEDFRRGRPEVTVERGRRLRWEGVRVHESTQFDRRLGRTRIDGVDVTGIDRTLIDIAGLVGFDRLLLAIDDARRRKLTTWPSLFETLVRHSVQGRNGAGVLRAVLAEKYGEPVVAESAFERMVERLLVDAGIVEPVLQHEVRDRSGEFVARLDLAWPRHRVGVELDGRRHLTDSAFERDPARRNRLLAEGWSIYTYTWRAYVDRPHVIVREVRAALAASPRDLATIGHL